MILYRQFYCFLLLLTACTPLVPAPGAEQLYREGVAHLSHGETHKAIRNFEQVLAKGYESAVLYHNLGTAYRLEEKMGQAVLNYEKALRMDPAHPQLQASARVLSFNIQTPTVKLPGSLLTRHIQSFIFVFSPDELAVAGIILWILSLGLMTVSLRKGIRRLKYPSHGLLLVAFFCFTAAGLQSYWRHQANQAVVMAPKLILKKAASIEAKNSLTLYEGEVVYVLDYFEGWYKVSGAKDKKGWVRESSLKLITLL